MIKKDSEYNKCFNWIKEKINIFGLQNITDLMWEAQEDNNVNTSYVSYIINYDDRLTIDNKGFVCLTKSSLPITLEAQPYSFGVLKA